MKKFFLSFALMLASLSMSAQTGQSHTVQRGETIESVAKKYGISVGDLQQANPSTRDFFYAGMKLVIPRKTSTQNATQTSGSNSTNRVAVATPSTTKTKTNPVKSINQKVKMPTLHSDLDGSDFTSVALTFGSDFTDLVGTTYGIQGQYFLDNGFGATLTAGANYGLEDDADVVFRVGPSYVYPLTNMFYVMGTACYTLTLADYEGNTGTVSGVSVIPTIGMSFNRIKVGINGDLHWRNGGDFGAGAYISVGYSF